MTIAIEERLLQRISYARSVHDCVAYLFLLSLSSTLDTIATLDNIGLEAYRAGPPMELQEQSTGVA